ncbi:ACT domain-containing protein DS12, chloroplastic [Capsicum annuum]|uniref:ACT domain-containing protein ACR12 isoform X1 n=1 Tax=Capsicum annuum TaxID=4072 RepID=UPI0007BF918C|nr:ACT domain-containing protein ACR12 isoform X1 [Capsicum annuum]KAF3640875.1 ACT domain-containing protein DS12, chloroplastic [Capsicum annuum]
MAIANAFCISLRSTISDAADSGVFSTLPPQFTASKLQSSAVLHSFSSSGGFVYRRKTYTVSCTLDGVDSLPPALKDEQESASVPLPVVQIIQDTECDATAVEISFGDRLGLLIDTMKALKDLGLDVVKGTVTTQDAVKKTKILITRLDTGRKVEDPDLLENIRLTIINNLMKYHPESSERLAMGEAFGIKAPEKKPDVDVATHIHVKDDGPKRSMLYVETADRSGLLMEIVKIMADINIHVESAEIDTEGLIAKDKFYVSYGGAALTKSLSQVLVNCLRYHLRRPETDEESY